MNASLKSALLFLFVFTALVLSCSKPGPDTPPTPQPPVNPITANPSVSGITGASVVADAAGTTYTITVPAGTDVKTLALAIPLAAGASISPNPGTARDYTNPVTFTVTPAGGGTPLVITVKVVVQAAPKSSDKQITAFSFTALNPAVTAAIDQTTRKITATVPADADLTKLVPTLTLSAKASVAPASGVVQNFSNAVNYTVTAEDGSSQVYEVKVEKAVIVSTVACLLVREEVTNSDGKNNHTIDYTHDQSGRIIGIKIVETNQTRNIAIDYDQNGNVTRFFGSGPNKADIRFTYQNGKVVKIENIGPDGQSIGPDGQVLGGDYISSGICKFNEKNELIQFGRTTYEYVNRNLTKSIYFGDYQQEFTAEISYDAKNSPAFSSKVPGIFTFLESGIFRFLEFRWFYFSNNIILAKENGKIVSSGSYTFNKNNFPTELKFTYTSGEAFTRKYTYSNCQ